MELRCKKCGLTPFRAHINLKIEIWCPSQECKENKVSHSDKNSAIKMWKTKNSITNQQEDPVLTALKELGKIGEIANRMIKPKTQESTPTSHDAHYNKADKRFGIESMRILEGINCTGIPEEYWDICKRNLSLCLEMKYVLRLGEKDAPEKELDKASNFQHRARTGKFPWG